MKTIKLFKTVASIAVLSAVSSTAWAAGTAAGTDVDNTASISYSVGGTAQTPIASSPTGNTVAGTAGTVTRFKVDKKIDLVVTSGSGVDATPGATKTIEYTLENQGNSTEFFKLAETQIGSDQFDTSTCNITTAPQTITASDTVQLIADATTTITVSCTIPPSDATVINGATSNLDLKATAVTDTAGATTYTESAGDSADPLVVDVVIADDNATTADPLTTDAGDRNASHSAVNTFTVNAAVLSVQKVSSVEKMSINGADDTSDPMRIPGATIKYTITVSNAAGGATATGIVISDTLPTGTTGPTASSSGLTFTSCSVTGPGTAAGECALTGAIVATNTASGISLAAGETATLTILATVN